MKKETDRGFRSPVIRGHVGAAAADHRTDGRRLSITLSLVIREYLATFRGVVTPGDDDAHYDHQRTSARQKEWRAVTMFTLGISALDCGHRLGMGNKKAK
jgi:hypothetical protein